VNPQRIILLLHKPKPSFFPSSSVKQEQSDGQVRGTGAAVAVIVTNWRAVMISRGTVVTGTGFV
jgi:hypothetical protein